MARLQLHGHGTARGTAGSEGDCTLRSALQSHAKRGAVGRDCDSLFNMTDKFSIAQIGLSK